MRALVPDQHAGVNRAVGADRQAGVNQPPARRGESAARGDARRGWDLDVGSGLRQHAVRRVQAPAAPAGACAARPARDDRRRSPAGGVEARWSGAAARLQRPFRYQSFIRGMALIRFQRAAAGSRDAREDLSALRGGRRRAAPSRTYGARPASARADARARGRSPRTSSDRGWPPGPVRGGRLTSG